MKFSQVSIFRLPEQLNPEKLEQALKTAPFVSCGSNEFYSQGFKNPVYFDERLYHPVSNTGAICFQREERILPASAVNKVLNERVDEIKEKEGRLVGRKERAELKELIIDYMLPKAFTKTIQTYGLFTDEFLFINTASNKKAENFLSNLRLARGGLAASTCNCPQSLSSVMSDWLLKGSCEGRFELDFYALLKGFGDVGSTVKCSRTDLSASEIVGLMNGSRTCVELGLLWDERVSFVLSEDFTFKKVKLLDSCLNGCDSSEEVQDGTQLILSHCLSEITNELKDIFGGWAE